MEFKEAVDEERGRVEEYVSALGDDIQVVALTQCRSLEGFSAELGRLWAQVGERRAVSRASAHALDQCILEYEGRLASFYGSPAALKPETQGVSEDAAETLRWVQDEGRPLLGRLRSGLCARDTVELGRLVRFCDHWLLTLDLIYDEEDDAWVFDAIDSLVAGLAARDVYSDCRAAFVTHVARLPRDRGGWRDLRPAECAPARSNRLMTPGSRPSGGPDTPAPPGWPAREVRSYVWQSEQRRAAYGPDAEREAA